MSPCFYFFPLNFDLCVWWKMQPTFKSENASKNISRVAFPCIQHFYSNLVIQQHNQYLVCLKAKIIRIKHAKDSLKRFVKSIIL